MHIKNLFKEKNTVISLEIFPPKVNSSIDTIYKTIENLAYLNPDFISVTYGALGSTKDKTVEIASLIKNKYEIESLAHLTCLTSSHDEINQITKNLKHNNISNILALRGDFPKGYNTKEDTLSFKHADDLVEIIKKNNDFCVAGACYPEKHPESLSFENDLYNLNKKVEKGTDFLISQLFFDNNIFYNFINQAKSQGINCPISAGIMPVINKKQIERIVSLTGASMSQKFLSILDRYEYNEEALKDAGIAYATEQIIDLISQGVDGIHIYTMNKPEIAKKIYGNIESVIKAV
ncbi:MAG: methylenetetrahydrofolate reductase [NAD(P)H], partial [Clostridiaceae bacterium]